MHVALFGRDINQNHLFQVFFHLNTNIWGTMQIIDSSYAVYVMTHTVVASNACNIAKHILFLREGHLFLTVGCHRKQHEVGTHCCELSIESFLLIWKESSIQRVSSHVIGPRYRTTSSRHQKGQIEAPPPPFT